MSMYEEAYKALTDHQREAVEYIDGPLLVLAGPGTGKTQLLSMRVANILKSTDVSGKGILCLTFTNKAAANMRSRLQKLIGSEALQVNVKTFHSLAAEIMGEYPDYFWNGARLTTAPDAVQTDIITNILSSLPLDNPLAMKFAGKFTGINDVQNGLKLAKEAGLTAEKLRAIIEVNLAYIDQIEPQLVELLSSPLSYKKLLTLQAEVNGLPDQPISAAITPLVSLSDVIKESLDQAISLDADTGKTKHTGEWKKQFVQNEAKVKAMHRQRRANKWWLHLADVYEMYRHELHARGCYDYADMLVEVIAVMEQQPSLLSEIQERYSYVLVDEFQDSNAAQMRLAHLISNSPVSEGKPNLMVVGDDDQSIYKFNGAELNNMLGFRRTYPTTKTIVLEENFRSSQQVLDTSRQVIELASDRLVTREPDISKNLIAKNEPKTIGQLLHICYPTQEHQYYEVAKQIKARYEAGETSIAVLARKNDSLRTLAAELTRQQVPVRYELQSNILDHEAVNQLLLLCETIESIITGDQSGVNQHIAQLLGHPMWLIDSKDLWQLAINNRFQSRWLESLLEHDNESLRDFGHWLIWLSQQAHIVPLPILFDYITGLRPSDTLTSPFRAYYLDARQPKTSYIEVLSAVQKLRTSVQEFVSSRSQTTLSNFVEYINLHKQNNLTISDTSFFVSSSEAVQLLTVHKAKGLEFDTVYIIDAIEKQWQPKTKRRSTPANLPLQPYGDDMDDYVRLMYVAMTRAKHSVIATSFAYDGAGEEVVASPLIASALTLQTVPDSDLSDTVSVLESSISWPELESDDARNILSPILEDFSLNVTGLMNFLDITKGGPQLFLERNLLRLPGARTVSLAFGTAIHTALEQAQRSINNAEFDLGRIKTLFEVELRKEPILPHELERWIPHGTTLLDKLFNEQLLVLPEGGIPEQRLQNIDINGAVIDGKLDHIIIDDSAMLISDFKTGAPLNSFFSKAKDTQLKIWKHRTQLIFYAMLASHHPQYAGKEIASQMLYLEADEPRNVARIYEPTIEEINRLAALSRAVYKKIVAYDLPDVSGYSMDIEGIEQFEQDLIDGKV